MGFFRELLDKPFRQLRVEQQLFEILVLFTSVFLIFYSIALVARYLRDRRRDARRPLPNPIQVSWQDREGSECSLEGRCRDISTRGMGMELGGPVGVATPVSFEVFGMNLAGTALVRHCTEADSKYVIGVEFRRVVQ